MTVLDPEAADVAADVAGGVDPQNPWLGLSSYSEATRAWFHGREEETAELARRVQRKPLTVLFGQSGLGKTSLLRAGLVPRLRDEGFCPVYVRVDYRADSPPPAEQIKQAIFRATAAAGHWSRPGTAVAGESLWEFLHHRGDLLRDAAGRTVLPLLIFDQFEEIFTLAQADDAGRERAKAFIEELADLVENRPPVALERRIDNDEAHADEYDFARADYRILIALREDYLAHLEALKASMPSITQNRMRLARMTGAQALSAVMKPGGRLVSQEVAESIVRFVAGGSELPNAEVEPSLLSLVCRELNTVRQAQGRSEISADLLAGSRDTILTEFYERSLADQPAGVRRVIEDELLTESGYRESLAEERVAKALAAAGAAPGALATLVDRRLLRIEERLDMRRVELTHDVLCSVVKASRDLRHEREARDEAERQLAAQRERAAETRRTLRRTRRFAMVAAALMLVAVVSAVFGWMSWNRAKVADEQAQKARADAERLVAFLIEDFYEELQPTGRTETLGKLAHMAVAYYDTLPAELRSAGTQVNRGMALVREAHALITSTRLEAANRNLEEATAIFQRLRDAGDRSEATAVGWALAKFTRYGAWGPAGAPGAKTEDLPQAIELLKPYVYRPGASRQAKLVYADMLNYRSHQRTDRHQAVADCKEARTLLRDMGALELKDLTAASVYADTADSEARHSMSIGLIDEAEQLEHEVGNIAEQVLAQRPSDFRSMQNRALSAGFLGDIARIRHDFDGYAAYAAKSAAAAENQILLNPTNIIGWDYLINARIQLADADFERGRIDAGIAGLQALVALKDDPKAPPNVFLSIADPAGYLALMQAETGQFEAAAASQRVRQQSVDAGLRDMASDDPMRAIAQARREFFAANMALIAGRAEDAYRQGMAVVERARAAGDDGAVRNVRRVILLRNALRFTAQAALRTGRPAEAEKLAHEFVSIPVYQMRPADPKDAESEDRLVLAHAVAAQGRGAEAQRLLEPDIARFHAEHEAGASGLTFVEDYVYALYVDALASSGPRRSQRLAEARALLATLPAEARRVHRISELQGWVGAAS
jgi:hypothetical protein